MAQGQEHGAGGNDLDEQLSMLIDSMRKDPSFFRDAQYVYKYLGEVWCYLSTHTHHLLMIVADI